MSETTTADRRAMHRPRPLCIAAMCATLWLTACGGGDGDETDDDQGPGDTLDLMPLAIGNRWLYDDLLDATAWGAGMLEQPQQTVSVLAAQNLDGRAGVLADLVYAKTGRWLYARDPSDPAAVTMRLLRFPVRAGDSFSTAAATVSDAGYDADGDGLNEKIRVDVVTSVFDVQTVTVGAGTFTNCIPVQTTSTSTLRYSSGKPSIGIGSVVETRWYSPGIGVVQRVAYSTIGRPIGTTRTLSGYVVDGRSGGTLF